jgi:outer membrane protein TolC
VYAGARGYVNKRESAQRVVEAVRAYQQAVIARAQAQAARLGDTAALFQALAGGWWNEPAGSALGQNDRPLAQQ